MKFEESLRDALHQDAVDLVPVGPGPDDARRRAFRRKRRLQSGVVMASAIVVAGGALAAIKTRPAGHGRVQSQPPAPTVDLAWRSVAGTVSFPTTHFTAANGVTYALSTAPGVQPDSTDAPVQGLYATHDGVTWTNPSLGATRVAALAENKGVLYSVSTGPAVAGSSGYQLATSTNGGTNWGSESVPVSFTAPAANVPLTVSNGVQVASQGDTTVVMAEASYAADFAKALDLGPQQSAQQTATGVKVVDSSGCAIVGTSGAIGKAIAAPPKRPAVGCEPTVVATHPFSDFGITNPAGLHQQEALVRTGNGAWQNTLVPIGTDSQVTDLTATSTGFLMEEKTWSDAPGLGTTQLLSSTDGRTWAPLATAVPAAESYAIAGDRIIAANNDGSAISTSTDAGATWLPTDGVAGLLPAGAKLTQYGAEVDAGPLGFAAIVSTGSADSPHRYLLHSSDGTSWKVTDLATVGAPAKGGLEGLVVGADHIDVTFGLTDATPAAGTPAQLVTLVATPKA